MQTRSFDLLTHPMNPGETLDAGATISWSGARNFVIAPADQVADHFDVGKWSLDAEGRLSVPVTCKGDRIARFAAIVTCDTDESDEQKPRDYAWPNLLG